MTWILLFLVDSLTAWLSEWFRAPWADDAERYRDDLHAAENDNYGEGR